MNRTNKKTNETLAAESAGVSLIERLRKGTDAKREITWPGSDERVELRCLSCTEVQEAESAAHERWKELKLDLDLWTSENFYSELTTQLIFRSLHRLDKNERLFSSMDELRDLITPDERTLIVSEYVELQNHANPDPGDLNVETVELIKAAIEKKDVASLSAFGSSTLAIFLLGTESPSQS